MMIPENLGFHLSEETGTEKQIKNILLGNGLLISLIRKNIIKLLDKESEIVRLKILIIFRKHFRLKNLLRNSTMICLNGINGHLQPK